MAYTKKTLANLKQSLADKHDAGVLPTDSATLSYWVRLLNEGQAYCSDRLRMETSTSLTVSSGSIALPDDFLLIMDVIDSNGVSLQQIPKTNSEVANGLVYWITGNQTDGFTLNSPTDGTYTVYYSFKPSEMSSDSDICIIPDPEAVSLYAYSKLRMAETDPLEDAATSMGEAIQRIREMQDAQQLNDQELAFTLPSSRKLSTWDTL